MEESVWEKLEAIVPLFDFALVEHHFTPYLRDYDVIAEYSALIPGERESYIAERYLYRFTHCVMASVITAVSDEAWRMSWSDIFTNYQVWEQSGSPDGYVWGVEYSVAYPGFKFIKDSALAKVWTERLKQPMYEIVLETNGHNLTIVFHDVVIRLLAKGDPVTRMLVPLD